MLGDDHTLTARCSGGGFGKASFGLAYREFHGASPATPAQADRFTLTRQKLVVTM